MEPISEVNISTLSNGTISKDDGTFFIDVTKGSELTFSHIGYVEIKLIAKNEMFVYLSKDILKLNEIIVESGLVANSYSNSINSLTILQQSDIRTSAIDHFDGIADRISNLNWTGGTSRARYFQIRGIGERSQYFGEGPPNFSIGYTLDDIDLSGLGMIGQLFDVSQIEVYKGPQSSVFGSNALGGLISLRSADPSTKNTYNYSLTIGNDQKKGFNGVINNKIHENLHLRISSSYSYANGFRKNQFLNIDNSNEKDELFMRTKILFSPFQNFSILATILFADLKNGYDAWAPDNNEKLITYSDSEGKDSQETNAGSIRINYNFYKTFSLKAISSYSSTKQVHSYDGDWANDDYWLNEYGWNPIEEEYFWSFFDSNNRQRYNFSQELRLSNQKSTFGLYYNKLTETDEATGYLYGGRADYADGKFNFQKLAAYFQSFFDFNNSIKIEFSARLEDYFYDYLGTSIDNYYLETIPTVNFAQSDNDRKPLLGFKIGFSYKPNNFTNIFISQARGYKAGGANQQPYLNNENRPFGPEFIDNFEFGLKTGKDIYAFSFSGFYGLRTDQQVSISSQQDPNDPNSFYFYTSNSGKGFSRGFESELRYKPSKSFTATTSLGFLDTYVEEFSYQADSIKILYGGNRESAMAPNLTGSFGAQYNYGNTTFASNTNYKSSYFYSDSHDYKSDPYFLTNFTIGQLFGRINLKFWVKNVFDKRYPIRGFYFALTPDGSEKLFKSYGDPRHFGFTLDYSMR